VKIDSIFQKPYKAIWLSIPIIFTLGLVGMKNTIDIQFHDTYLVITPFHLGILFSIILGIVGCLYWLFRNKELVKWMSSIHIFLTIVTLFFIIILSIFWSNLLHSDFQFFKQINNSIFLLFAIFMISQLMFIINIIIGILRHEAVNYSNKKR
jgi:heme/copper-type cytochrome/quinol oxidase subunit 1